MANVERVGSGRVLKGTAGSLEITVYSDGTLTDPTLASVAVVDGQGNAVTVGAPTIVGGGSGRVTSTIDDAETAQAKTLVATWALTVGGNSQTFVTYHQVVGDALFTEAELRAFDQNALAGVNPSDSAILAMHELVAEAFEQIVGTAMGLRFEREYLDGDGTSSLWLKRFRIGSVLAAATREAGSTTWTALTASELADLQVYDNGQVVRESLGTWPSGRRNLRVDYTYGYQPVPHELRRAAMWVARNYLAGSNVPRNAISQLDELGTFRLAVPGERGSWFGLPEVDRVLRDYRSRNHMPGVA